MKLIDLHCDTADEIYRMHEGLKSNGCHVSLDKALAFDKYLQCFAVFTSPDLSDGEGWEEFLKIRENLLSEFDKNGVAFIKSKEDLIKFAHSEARFGGILTVEDVRILDGRTERVQELYDLGVRIVTPLWGGKTIIGGSHDTDEGLTEFGRQAVCEMAKVGIIPDISHASFKSADEIMDICEKSGVSPVATHMNSYAVCPVSRNLTDERYLRLTKLGGIAGVSLCPPHLTTKPEKSRHGSEYVPLNAIAPHFRHYSSLVPGKVCFGCDLDGTGLPRGIGAVDGLGRAFNILRESGFSESELEEISWGTAYSFLEANLK